MPLPLDALREVQDSLSNNMWMLGLPELAPFRAFILDAAAQCESGAVERALREVRREAREERDEQQREGRDERPLASRGHGFHLCFPRVTVVPTPACNGASRDLYT